MPAKPRWLLAIPDAISQLEKLDRTLLTRRDIERLFGVSTARAATLMQTFGAEMTGYQRTLPRTKLLRQLRKHRARAAFRGEEERRERLLTGLRKARLTGIRVTLPAETLDAKLASLPEGVSVSRDRIEVRFNGAKEAVERLYALAHALVNDYERFEQLVDGGEAGDRERCWNDRGAGAGGRGDVGRRGQGSAALLPRVIVDAGAGAVARYLEFFAGGSRTRGRGRAYGRAVGQFLAWCETRGLGLESRLPAPRGRLHPDPPRICPDRQAAPRRDPACSATGSSSARSSPQTPPRPSGGPKHVVTKGSTPVLVPAEARQLLHGIDLGHPGRAPGPGAPPSDALQLRAGERGPGDEEAGLLPAGEQGVAAAPREGREAARRAGSPPARRGPR